MRGTLTSVYRLLDKPLTAPVLIAIGTIIRVLVAIPLASVPLAGDAGGYHKFALQIASGTGHEFWWPPGLSLYLIPFHLLFGASRIVSILAMIPWYMLTSIMLYHLAHKIGDRMAGLVALAFLAIWPTFIFHSVYPSTQLPLAALLLVTATLLFQEKGSSGFSILRSLLLGLFLGVATLIRPSSFLLVIIAPLTSPAIRRKPTHYFVVLATSLLVLAPWLLEARRATGHWVPVNQHNARNMFLGNNQWTPLYKTWYFGSHYSNDDSVPSDFKELDQEILAHHPKERNAIYLGKALSHILERPDLFLLRSFNRARCFLAFDTFTGIVLMKQIGIPKVWGWGIILADAAFYLLIIVLAIPALLMIGRKTGSLIISTLLAIILAYAFPYWIAFSHPTYHLPVVPLLLILAAVLISNMASSHWPLRGMILPCLKTPLCIAILAILFYIQLEWILIMINRIHFTT